MFTGVGKAVVNLSTLCPKLETDLKMKQQATVMIPGLGEQKMVNDLTISSNVASGE